MLRLLGMLLAGALGLAACGCAHGRRDCAPCCDPACPDELPEVERGAIYVDVDGAALAADVEAALGDPAAPIYRALTPEQCQCLAAEASRLGNALADERAALDAEQSWCQRRSAESELRRSLLWHAEAEARNHSAANALEVYYLLAQAEAGRDLLAESLAIGEAALADYRTLSASGLALPQDEGELLRQALALRSRAVRLDVDLAELNAKLQTMLGYEPCGGAWRIWPLVDLRVAVEPLDREAEVDVGLSHRAELCLWRALLDGLTVRTLAAARDALQSVSPLLGQHADQCRDCCHLLQDLAALLKVGGAKRELEERRAQVAELLADREREVAAEIRRWCDTIEARLREIALANETAADWELRIRDAEERQQAGRGTPFDVHDARAGAVEARAAVLGRVVAWKLAQVELREQQGLLAVECGYDPCGECGTGDYCDSCQGCTACNACQ
jgi:hypothetical protein